MRNRASGPSKKGRMGLSSDKTSLFSLNMRIAGWIVVPSKLRRAAAITSYVQRAHKPWLKLAFDKQREQAEGKRAQQIGKKKNLHCDRGSNDFGVTVVVQSAVDQSHVDIRFRGVAALESVFSLSLRSAA
jgi:hypothetical protein